MNMKEIVLVRKKIIMRRILYVICCIFLAFAGTSCTDTASPSLFAYADSNADYTITVTEDDSDRSITLDVKKRDGFTEGTVTLPESMSGVRILYDGSGTRIISGDCEIPLSGGAADGAIIFFDALAFKDYSSVSADKSSENGETSVKYSIGDSEIDLILDSGGFPKSLDVKSNGRMRHAEIKEFTLTE